MLQTESYVGHFERIWEDSPGSLPDFKRRYTPEDQKTREDLFSGLQEKANSLKSKRNIRKLKDSDPGQTFFPVLRNFLENIFDFDPDQLNIILSDPFKHVSRDFYYEARQFAPELQPENIYQGMRNIWIMNSIQLMMGLPVGITPSIFAYSMIYPYSDNMLDDPDVMAEEKQDFSDRFNLRLHGHPMDPQNHTESQLFRLVKMFEDQYPRNRFPGVYDSLYAIQQAQTRSLNLMDNKDLKDTAVREICFEKGGASVLADGYLVAGKLTPVEEQALFGYGVYLQLLDDLQDVKEDSDAHTRTLFSCLNGSTNLEAFVNRTIHFGRKAMDELRCFDGTDMEPMLRLMNHSVEMMIVESVGLNPQSYSPGYLEIVEKYSPLRYEFIRQKRTESGSQRFAFFKKYLDQVPANTNFRKSSTAI